ncbi:hypothetical protein LIER_38989 [Lithospermum erythrorhizon]|uniref:Uncharacterized protein n=1 Tax=Lithospermum erythrorhizon TaxID=34254 RepID=A0AAV3Q7Z3_LITER
MREFFKLRKQLGQLKSQLWSTLSQTLVNQSTLSQLVNSPEKVNNTIHAYCSRHCSRYCSAARYSSGLLAATSAVRRFSSQQLYFELRRAPSSRYLFSGQIPTTSSSTS